MSLCFTLCGTPLVVHLAAAVKVQLNLGHKNTCKFNILPIVTVREMVSLDTPLKKEAAPTAAERPGSIHSLYSLTGAPEMETKIKPIILSHKAATWVPTCKTKKEQFSCQ